MLNSEQLMKLNDIFHTAIKPVMQENEEKLNGFMKKVQEYREFATVKKNQTQKVEELLLNSIYSEMLFPSSTKNVKNQTVEIAAEKKLRQNVKLNVEINHTSLNSTDHTISAIINTKISTDAATTNVSKKVPLAA
ncbi:hypothetical protein [Planococcus sp. ISL-110]|uniref:hypothetical protein n=1 Tax=Planococcus sp. ISL-110 TaxID=2819167 RepID=UPI001BEB7E60|nr:hypothetical protein [Planococcus sp. ISL-110]MBT2569836.1 hypothetical protein [Planococcus sp. ISL-110]